MDRSLRFALLALGLALQPVLVRASAAQTAPPVAVQGAPSAAIGIRALGLAPVTPTPLGVAPMPDTAPGLSPRSQSVAGAVIGGLAGGVLGMSAGALYAFPDGDPNSILVGLGVGTVVGATAGALLGHAYTPKRTPR